MIRTRTIETTPSNGARVGQNGAMSFAFFPLVVAFWCISLALGGSGADYPLIAMGVQILAILLGFGTLLVIVSSSPVVRQGVKMPAVVIGLLLLLPLLQLVPLPPSLWGTLPGREREVAILSSQGWDQLWMPLSLDPEATKRAAISLLPGVAMFVATYFLKSAQRRTLAAILVWFAVGGAALGALQVASGGAFTLFDSVHRGHALGLFTNRNHQAIFLLIALVLGSALVPGARNPGRRQEMRWLAAGIGCLLVAGVLATKSRSGATLLLLAVPAAVMLGGTFKVRWKVATAFAANGLSLSWLLMRSSTVQDLLARFQSPDDDRVNFWANTIVAIKQHGLLGSGFGTFPTIYRTVEPLSDLTSGYVNHAHCDYLELLLEGGIPAIALVVLALGWISSRAIKLIRADPAQPDTKLALAALLGLLILILHSLVDYPLRMLSIEVIFGFLCALLLPPHVPAGTARHSVTRQLSIGLGALLALFLVFEAVVLGLASHAVVADSGALASRLSDLSAEAASLASQEGLGTSSESAAALARSALKRAPLNVEALSTLALAMEKRGRDVEATKLMNLAAGAGWWDDATQLWMFNRALAVGRYGVAMERVDALLRRDLEGDKLFAAMVSMAKDREGMAALISRLEDRPSWREDFLRWLSDADLAQDGIAESIWLALAQSEAPPSDRELAIYVSTLIHDGRYQAARSLWSRTLSRAGKALPLIYDGDFNRAGAALQEGTASPFQWRFNDDGGTSTEIDAPPGALSGVALHINANPGYSGDIAKQLIVLPAGSYRLRYASLSGEDGMDGVKLSVRCVNDTHSLSFVENAQAMVRNDWIGVSRHFEVPADCPAQYLQIEGTGEAMGATDIWFDRIAIVPF
jgi:O-antigen ligase/Flp pilus assembly protein TadD